MIRREISDSKFQIDALDGVRGLAALIVVFSHTSNQGMYLLPFLDFRGIGKSGVFAFFILSAFLLTMPLLHAAREVLSVKSMSHYWQRRFFRIYPLYFLYLLCALATTFLVAEYVGGGKTGVPFSLDFEGFVRHLLLLEAKGLTWSIAVEFKFYFVLPVIVYALVVLREKNKALVFPALFLVAVGTQIFSPQSESLVNDARLLPYMIIFIFGVALAVAQHDINATGLSDLGYRVIRALGLVGVLGLVLLTPAVYSQISGQLVPNYFFHKQFIAYSLCWSLVIMSAINTNGLIKSFFCLRCLRFFGPLSFSLYLLHPIFIRTAKLAGLDGMAAAWFVLMSATAASYVSFRIIEGPVSKFKIRSFS